MSKGFVKSFRLGSKGASAGVEITADILSKINRFALKTLTAEEVYARKFILAHNAVDRDGERFHEALLDDFAGSLPGKSFLKNHDRRDELPLGLYFDAVTEEISREEFKALTGEDPILPEGTERIKVLWSWLYILKTAGKEELITNLEGGVYRHASIGFQAADLRPVKGQHGEIKYWEYSGPGEALEGSLVWLGAQHGATAQKAARAKHTNEKDQGGKDKQMDFFKSLGKVVGKTLTEENIVETIKSLLGEKDAEITKLETANEGLKGLAAEGKLFRKSLVDDYARMKGALGECESTEEALGTIKKFAGSMDIKMLQMENRHLQARMEEKYPDGFQVESGDPNKNRSGKKPDEADKTGGQKTATSEDNPLIPEE